MTTIAFFLSVSPAATAAPSGPQLLVVVETGADVACDPESVRAAIGAELRASIVAPQAPSVVALAGPPKDTLLVAIDTARIVVTLRGRGGEEVTRSAATPADPAERLRAVAWLAANVTRDQLATTPLHGASINASPNADSPTTPPPAAAAGLGESTPAARVVGAAPASEFPTWTFSAVGGAAAAFPNPWQSSNAGSADSQDVIAWRPTAQLEAHRHIDASFVGAAVDLGPGPIHPFGAAFLLGRQAQAGRARLEASVGVGLQAFVDRTYYIAGSGAGGQAIDPGYVQETHTLPYARLALAASYELTPRFDLLAQAGGHLTLTSRGGDGGFGLGALGLRVRVP